MMRRPTQQLSPEQERAVLRVLRQWRNDPSACLDCPTCGEQGARVIDRSARPHSEWYDIQCSSCGFDHALQIPLGTRPDPI